MIETEKKKGNRTLKTRRSISKMLILNIIREAHPAGSVWLHPFKMHIGFYWMAGEVGGKRWRLISHHGWFTKSDGRNGRKHRLGLAIYNIKPLKKPGGCPIFNWI